ncbi:MAG TPA: LysM domain-containing protein [Sphingomonas sp.]|nr:LysM domain-containing protein [Sphingomonas sp.]
MTSTHPRARRAKWTVLIAGLALSACSHGLGESGRPQAAAPAAASPVQRYDAVVAALQHGDTNTAQKVLKRIRKQDPNDARARLLGETIDIDPVAMLGSRSFPYTVKPGDSLRELAGRYLGNPDKFYALARYNHIAIPDAIKPGQTLRIPGAPPAEQTAPAPRAIHPANAEPAHRAPSAPAKPAPPPQPKADPARAARYRAAGLSALNRGQVDRAVDDLTRAAALDPGNAVIKRDLDRAQRIRRTVKARK